MESAVVCNSGWTPQGNVPYLFGMHATGNDRCISEIVGATGKSDERPFRRCRKGHELEIQEGAVMVRLLDHDALLPVMTGVNGILVISKQVHKVLGRAAK